jgi:hypothetical protein
MTADGLLFGFGIGRIQKSFLWLDRALTGTS